MKKRIIKLGVCLSVVVLATIGVKMANSEQISSIRFVFSNMEALADDDEGGKNYRICYHESVVKTGYTYYDCGTCSKVYDEKGKGSYSKCFK